MLSCEQFLDHYWTKYVSLEKDFLETCRYVTLNEDNFDTYSSAYLRLLIELGSEADIMMKEYCKCLEKSFRGSKICQYINFIFEYESDFFTQKVVVYDGMLSLTPWAIRIDGEKKESPYWWIAYNKCKHRRTEKGTIESQTKEYYKFANQKYTLNALASVYQIYIYLYKRLADLEGNRVKVPIPGSRMFRLEGGDWDSVEFYKDVAFYVDFSDGRLHYETGKHPW